MKSMEGLNSGARVPTPPGTRRTSRGGAVAKVWVGRMDWEKVEDSLDWPTAVGMGERVEAMMERVMS